jgi:hypothetical protein
MKSTLLITVASTLLALSTWANPDKFNYILGTHSIGAHYQFTDKTRLIETADIIHGMGSNFIITKKHPCAWSACCQGLW